MDGSSTGSGTVSGRAIFLTHVWHGQIKDRTWIAPPPEYSLPLSRHVMLVLFVLELFHYNLDSLMLRLSFL